FVLNSVCSHHHLKRLRKAVASGIDRFQALLDQVRAAALGNNDGQPRAHVGRRGAGTPPRDAPDPGSRHVGQREGCSQPLEPLPGLPIWTEFAIDIPCSYRVFGALGEPEAKAEAAAVSSISVVV